MNRSDSTEDCETTKKVKSSHIFQEQQIGFDCTTDNKEYLSKKHKKNKKTTFVSRNSQTNLPVSDSNSDSNLIQNLMQNSVQIKTNGFGIITNKFDPDNENKLKSPSSMLIIGKRNIGKSHAIIHIASSLKSQDVIDNCVVICPTDKFQNLYKTKLNIHNVCHECDDDILKSIIENQENKIIEATNKNTKKPRLLLILDDCGYLEAKKSVYFRNLILNGRHLQIYIIMAIQFPSHITKEIQTNFDFIFLGPDDTISNQKRYYEHYAGMFPTFLSFKETFDNICKNYTFLTIENNSNHIPLENKIKYFKADIKKSCDVSDSNLYIDTHKNDTKTNVKNIKHVDNTKYDVLQSILTCNTKICTLIKNDENNQEKINIMDSIVKCNNLIVEMFNTYTDKDIILDVNKNIDLDIDLDINSDDDSNISSDIGYDFE